MSAATDTTGRATHTPGPWRVEIDHRVSGVTLIDVLAADDECICEFSSGDDLRDHANARTVAAAPELLAALKAMVASYDGIRDTLTSPIVLQKLVAADAAIAKAEGL